MRRALVCLVVCGLSVLVVWGCKYVLDSDEDASTAKDGKLKEEDFRLVRAGRRDPFESLFTPTTTPPDDRFTPDDFPRACGMLSEIQADFRRFHGNPSPHAANQLRKNIDSLETFLGRPCDHLETTIHIAELRRRTRNYETQIDATLRAHDAAVHVAQLEVWLDEALDLAGKGKVDEAEAALSRAERLLADSKVSLAMDSAAGRTLRKKIELVREKTRPLRFAKGIQGAEEALSLMRVKFQTREFEGVLTNYLTFCSRIESVLKPPAPPLDKDERQKIEYLAARAKDIYGQARIAIAQRKLDEIEAVVSQAESSLLCDEFDSTIEHANDAAQFLRAVEVPAPLGPRKSELLLRAQGLARRASIRREFLKHPPAVAGVGIEPGNSVALVNNKVLREGDYLDANTRVKMVASGYVVFTYKGEDIRVGTGL
ncbi:MAG: hypothetical protein AB1696_17830 [Planctomycetota bacterium]